MRKIWLSMVAILVLGCFCYGAKADCNFTGTYQNSAGQTRVTYACVSAKGIDYDVDVNWLTAVVYYGYLGL